MPSSPDMPSDPNLPRTWIKPYYGSFNGLRGVAILTVFCNHYAEFYRLTGIQNCTWIGVDLFFVLSGFLITGILYDALQEDRFFRNFYIRRALRIFPLFYSFFLLLFLLTPLLHLHYSLSVLTFFFYFGNQVVPFINLGTHNPTTIQIMRPGGYQEIMNIGQLWTLCVEEQFYLIWPAVIFFVRDRRRLIQICIGASIVTLLVRCYIRLFTNLVDTHYDILFWSTLSRCDTLLIGSAMALWLRGTTMTRAKLASISSWLFCGSLAAFIAGVATQPKIDGIYGVLMNPFICTLGFTLIALAAMGIILRSLDDESRLSRMLRWRPLQYMGTISYGFYFIHTLPKSVMVRFTQLHPAFGYAVPVIAFPLTLALATLSFRYLETPFLRLKNRFAPQRSKVDKDGEFQPMRLHVSEPQT